MTAISKQRIEVIDALRGFALTGILFVHFLEHFDATWYLGNASPVGEWINNSVADIIRFLFLGKSYTIFSMLFGLSFFIQMNNNEKRGIDFRLRFIWRLLILYVLGYINGLFYSGEILVVYALFGLILIPLYRMPVKWLIPICLFFLLLIPNILYGIYVWINPETTDIVASLLSSGPGYMARMAILTDGTFGQVMLENSWSGQVTKWMWYLEPINGFKIFGLFMAGLLIGKLGIHNDEKRMVEYAKKGLIAGFITFALFFCLNKMIPLMGIDNQQVANIAGIISHKYACLGLMFFTIGIFLLAYFRLDTKDILNKLAPVGRMSLTVYMVQSVIGALIFYGFGLGLAAHLNPAITTLLALFFGYLQICACKWWMNHHYYGPVEWVWRRTTWFNNGKIPLKKSLPKR